MLTIDRLRLSLPAGYESRAERIARFMADELADVALDGDARYDRLALPTLEVKRGTSDRRIARSIARAIASHLNPPTQGGT